MPDCRLIVQGDGAARDAILRELGAAGGHRGAAERRSRCHGVEPGGGRSAARAPGRPAAAFSMPSKALTCLAAGVRSDQRAAAPPSPMSRWRAVVGGSFRVARRRVGHGCGILAYQTARATGHGGARPCHVRRHHDPSRLLRRYDRLLFASLQADAVDRARPLTPKAAAEP
jgi:hypothetical protein